MIHLVFVACLISSPELCDERTLSYVEPMSPMACAMQAQPELAKWNNSHPNYVIRKWRCEVDRNFRA